MKKLQSIILGVLLITFLLAVDSFGEIFVTNDNGEEIISTNEMTYNEKMVEEIVFPHDEVVEVNIDIVEEDYIDMLNNAKEEEYVIADVTYNGQLLNNVAIRPKGNSSLSQVAATGDDRFSFKIDFDKYVDGQNLYGITKINLNNLYKDPSLMAEYMGYELLDSIDAVGSDTSYVALSINGEYYGLYLAVEEVDETFLMTEYSNYDGELYKPDMGVGADLAYISDNPDDYTGVFPQDDEMETDEKFIELVKVIDEVVNNGGETEQYQLSDVINVDSFLKYLAMSTATIHLDTYQKGMFHNYYLYYNTALEKYEWISWDLNMIFNGFPQGGTDAEVVTFYIDEPVVGEMVNYPLIEAVFTNEVYVLQYHEYLEEIINGYLSEESFEERVLEIYAMIEPYASIDENAFYSMEEVKAALFQESSDAAEMSLLEFVSNRSDNIDKQLSGELPSTNNGEGNAGDIGMGMRGGNGMKGMKGAMPESSEGMQVSEGMQPPERMQVSEGMQPPERMQVSEGMQPPEGMQSSEGMQPPEGIQSSEGMQPPERMQSSGDMNKEGNEQGSSNNNTVTQWIFLGLSLLLVTVFSGAMYFRKY